MKLLPNGNIEMTVQLLPSVYAALREVADRDGGAFVDHINVAILSYGAITTAAAQAEVEGKSDGGEPS